jgi:hypothetical protein
LATAIPASAKPIRTDVDPASGTALTLVALATPVNATNSVRAMIDFIIQWFLLNLMISSNQFRKAIFMPEILFGRGFTPNCLKTIT